jgi:ATP-dependent DNA helicase RecG
LLHLKNGLFYNAPVPIAKGVRQYQAYGRIHNMRPEALNPFFKPVSSISGVGPKAEKLLARLLNVSGFARIGDLLFHLPVQIIDRSFQPGISTAPAGTIVTMKVRIGRHQPPPPGKRRVPYRVRTSDETGEMDLVFFNARPDWIARTLPEGEIRYVSGRTEIYNGHLNMVHPDYIVEPDSIATLPRVEPVYPATAGLTNKFIAKYIQEALETVPELPEWNESAFLSRLGWPSFSAALKQLHNPRTAADLDLQSPSRRRLAHDELFAGQLALALMRETMRKSSGSGRKLTGEITGRVRTAFGKPLTGSQERALDEIFNDLKEPKRMLRLLQGDVGSGKTIVALVAMAAAIEDGSQAAIMAPTEILARQHMTTIAPICDQIGLRTAILTGREKGRNRERTMAALAQGEIDILVGTHALLQSTVEFRDLGLAVIDEQHRFGVHQRMALGSKGRQTDILIMTATPIPRTLVLTYFGDMDVSNLTEKPPGRQKITTTAMPLGRLGELLDRVAAAIGRGERLYWICPLVEESDELPVTAAEDRFQALAERFGDRVGLVHGRMKSAEKDAAMDSFREGNTNILVATTVVEVGVDVPEATIMIIEHAERFGLAQLHQLRGRIGRGDKASHCILLYGSPLGETAKARIKVMRETDDGFRIAEEDLRLRGEGEILGTRQSGAPGFSLADAEAHADLLEMARDNARYILARESPLEGERGEALRILLYLFGQDQAVKLLRAG